MLRIKSLVLGTAAAACLAIGLAPAATAATPPAGSAAPSAKSLYAPSVLVLTKSQGADAPVERAVMLRCLPVGGDHPVAADACSALNKAGGDPAALPAAVGEPSTACTTDWRPVTVTVQGTWDGRLVHYTKTFGNTCEMEKQTSSVFAF
ncbi:subtilase-type protease inhibitor [Streptomyces sp. ODS28]|uniref:subtilase-type protease inhibitor n=1 Tax=Streptomyces sp. ODS28 TaxID=3136688 RepID=UPI0031EDC4B7